MSRIKIYDIEKNEKFSHHDLKKITGGFLFTNALIYASYPNLSSTMGTHENQASVAFAHGDTRRPVLVGDLWSSETPPPDKND